MIKPILVSVLMLSGVLMYSRQSTDLITEDTLKADKYKRTADSLRNIGVYDEAYLNFLKSQRLYQKWEVWSQYLTSKGRVGDMLWRLSRFTSADSVLAEVIAESHTYLGEVNLPKADALYTRGAIAMSIGKRAQAIEYVELALDNFTEMYSTSSAEVGRCYNLLGIIYAQSGDFDKSLGYILKDLQITQELHGENHINFAQGLEVMANLHWSKTDYDSALYYTRRSEAIYTRLFGSEFPSLSTTYNNLGLLNRTQGNNDQALAYFAKSKRLFEKNVDKNSWNFMSYHMNVGGAYFEKEQFDSALVHYNKSLDIAQEIYGPDHTMVATLLSNIALVYEDRYEYDLADQYYKQALITEERVSGSNHLNTAQVYVNMGRMLYNNKRYNESEKKLLQAISIQKRLGERDFANAHDNHYLVESYFLLASVFAKTNQADLALRYAQASLVRNVYHFTDSLNVYKNPETFAARHEDFLLKTLELKAEISAGMYDETDEAKHLEYSLEASTAACNLIDQMRMYRSFISDRVNMGKEVQRVTERAIETCLKLFEIQGDQELLAEAFGFSERNRAFLIRQNLKNSQAKLFSGIPDSLLKNERELKLERSRLQSKLLSVTIDSVKQVIENELFITDQEHQRLIAVFEQEYPEYFKLKYNLKIPQLSEIQSWLEPDQLFIEYFQGNKAWIVFGLSKEQYTVMTIEESDAINEAIKALKGVFERPEKLNTSSTEVVYLSNASLLHDALIKPVLDSIGNESISHLVIAPDGNLHRVPFAALLTENTSGFNGYRDLPYLMKKYRLSNTYLVNMIEPRSSDKIFSKEGVFAMAPEYTSPDSLYGLQSDKFRDYAGPLAWNKEEARVIVGSFGGEAVLGDNAVESAFKEKANLHQVVHLAMHALVDNETPMNSKLLFTSGADTTEDSYLHAFELYNMQIDNELIVLSACNTEVGQWTRGEGLMSLSRAFAFAGVPSLVVSQWQIDDKATSELMSLFYTHLAGGKDKAEALRQAQLEFLQTAGAANTHPFYWSSFALIGDVQPLSRGTDNSYFFLLILLIGLPLAAFLISRQMRHKKRGLAD